MNRLSTISLSMLSHDGSSLAQRDAIDNREKLYQDILETMDKGAVIATKEGDIIYANRHFCQMVHAQMDSVTGNSIYTYVHEHHEQIIRRILRNESRQRAREIILKTARKTYIPAYMKVGHSTVRRTDECYMIFTDLTQSKRSETKKYEFIGIASHELKTPLTSVLAFTQLLSKYFSDKHDMLANNYLIRMEKQLKKLSNLVTDLLDTSKVQSGKLKLNMERIVFDDIIKEIVSESFLNAHKHRLRVEGFSGVEVIGDRYRLSQVFLNIIHNALKYSDPTHDIVIKSYTSGKTVTVSVTDFGIGIPSNQLRKIFRRFYRIETKERETYPGMGLGLYLSAVIIRRHKGKIAVRSRKGEGTTFWVSLPISQTPDLKAASLHP